MSRLEQAFRIAFGACAAVGIAAFFLQDTWLKPYLVGAFLAFWGVGFILQVFVGKAED